MLVDINITLDLPADYDRLFRLTELMNQPVDTLAAIAKDTIAKATMAPAAPPTPKPVPPPIPVPEPTPPPAAAAEPPRTRKPRAAKAAPAPVEDTGLADTDEPDPVQDLNGPLDDDDDDGASLGLAAPSMTGQDALESGLGKVRVMYAKGHKVSVKQLQQQFNVASFQDIPPTDGHKFLATVIKLEEQLGLRV